ncbi:MAG: hypothetical protein WEB52_05700 [Dehalococcoidia bacterium]
MARKPAVLTIDVAEQTEFPDYQGPCRVCDGNLLREHVEFRIVRQYDERPVTVALRRLPVLRCESCGVKWVLKDVLQDLEPQVQEEFQAALGNSH